MDENMEDITASLLSLCVCRSFGTSGNKIGFSGQLLPFIGFPGPEGVKQHLPFREKAQSDCFFTCLKQNKVMGGYELT